MLVEDAPRRTLHAIYRARDGICNARLEKSALHGQGVAVVVFDKQDLNGLEG